MKDIFGRELKIGDFVLFGDLSLNFCGIVVGENQVYRVINGRVSADGGIFKKDKFLYLSVDTPERKEYYDFLVDSYKNYLNNKMKSYSLYENINVCDVVILDRKQKNKYVYLGYCEYSLSKKGKIVYSYSNDIYVNFLGKQEIECECMEV